MGAEYTIVTAKNAGEKDNPHGGTLVKWYLSLRNSEGVEKGDVYCQRKPGNDLAEGQTVYGRVESGQYGPRLYIEQRPDGQPAPSNGSSSTPGTPTAGTGYRDNGPSIEAQVAFKGAVDLICSEQGKVDDLLSLTVKGFAAIQAAKNGVTPADPMPPVQPHAMAETSDVPADTSDFEGDGRTAPPDSDDIPF